MVSHFTTFWQTLVLCANICKLYDDCFLVHCNACVVYFTKYPLHHSALRDSQRKVKHGTEVVIEETLRHQSKRVKNRLLSCYYTLSESCLNG